VIGQIGLGGCHGCLEGRQITCFEFSVDKELPSIAAFDDGDVLPAFRLWISKTVCPFGTSG
jgi:hypothetical protein